jgi:predicted nucleotidyltransferase
MNRNRLIKLVEKLNEVNYAFFAGLAIEAYTNGKRKHKDVDILVAREEMQKVGKIFNADVEKKEKIKAGNVELFDYLAIQTKFEELELEFVSDARKMKFKNIMTKLNELSAKDIKNANTVKYMGVEVKLQPVEELMVHKAIMAREKDINDIKLLLHHQKIDERKMEKALHHWNISKEYIERVVNNIK